MNPETLALLTARSVRLDAISTGGRPELTPADVCMALSGCGRYATAWAYVQYCGDLSPLPELARGAWLRAVDTAHRELWWQQIPRGSERIRKLSETALIETIADPICPHCHGTRRLSGRFCHHCDQTGKVALTDSRVADLIGIDRSNYRKCWKPKYQSVRQDIHRWVCGLDAEIRFNIKHW